MAVYAVFLNEENDEAWAKLIERWPDDRHFILTDNLAFVAPERITTTSDVGEAVGMNDDHGVVGIVFEWEAHYGFNSGSLWEWLRQVQKARP